MDKLRYLKTTRQNTRDLLRHSNNARQARFTDKLQLEGNKVPFKHSWALMKQMHDLRVWTLAYAPGSSNNLQRLQEIHRLNNEMWYNISEALWRRIIFLIGAWFLLNKVFKDRFMNRGQIDTHEAHFRENTAHM